MHRKDVVESPTASEREAAPDRVAGGGSPSQSAIVRAIERWRPWALPGLALGLVLVAYRELLIFDPAIHVSAEVEEFFFEPSYTSPRVVLGLSLWLLYRRRERLLRLPLGAGSPGPAAALLAAGICVLMWSTYTGAPDLLALSLSLNLLGVAALLRGPRAIRVLAVPAAFLLLAIPVPSPLLNHVLFPLQLITASYTGWLLHALGVPAYVLGDQILGAEGNFAVIEGCSGMRSIESLCMIAILLVDLFRRTGLHALLILLAAPAVAFGLNGLRAATLVLNPHSEIVAIHNLQGIAILLAGLIALYLLDGLLARALRGRGRSRAAPLTGPSRPDVAARRLRAVVGVAAAAAALSLWLPRWQLAWPTSELAARQIPDDLAGWRARTRPVDWMFLGRVGFGQVVSRTYRQGREQVYLFVGVGDRSQRLRSPLSPKNLYPGSGWSVEENGGSGLDSGDSGRGAASSRVVHSTTSRQLVYHLQVGSGSLGAEVVRSLLALDSSPLRRESEGVVVRISTPVDGPADNDLQAAEDRLLRFYRDLRPELLALGERLTRGKGFPDFPVLGKDFPPHASLGSS